MTAVGLAAGFLLPIAAGTMVIRLASPDLWLRSRILVVSLGAVLGVGCSSLLFASSLFVFGARGPFYLPIEIALWGAVLAVSLRVLRRTASVPVVPFVLSRFEMATALLFAGTLAVSVVHFYWSTVNAPLGSWDAQAIWNLRARFLYRGLEGHWRDGFQAALAWSLPEYPLMLPSSIARLWAYARTESPLVPVVLACLFQYVTVGILVGALMAARRRVEAFVAGSLLLATYAFNVWGVAQVSDVPLGAFVLAATVLLSWVIDQREASAAPAMAVLTFCAGCAAWTKDEGLVFAVAICAVLALVGVWQRRSLGRGVLFSIAGLSLPLAVLVYFKSNVAPPSYLAAADAGNVASQWYDVERHKHILRSFNAEFWNWKPTGVRIIPYVIAYGAGAAAVLGVRRAQALLILPLLAMLGGYYAAYVMTPLDYKWQIQASLSRVLVQVWPSVIYVCFALPRSVEEIPRAMSRAEMIQPPTATPASDTPRM